MDDVEVSRLSELTAIGIVGPEATQALHTAGFDILELEPLQFVETNWRNIPLTVVRGDNPSVETYEVWLASGPVTAIRDALIQAGAKPVDTNAMELLRIAAGIPRYGQDIRERDLPQETEQHRCTREVGEAPGRRHFTRDRRPGRSIGPRQGRDHADPTWSWGMVRGSRSGFLEGLAACQAILAGVRNCPGVTASRT